MPTDRAAASSRPQPLSSTRAHQIAAFYARHAASLERMVARRLGAPAQVIEDACQTAWTILLRRGDVPLDRQGLAWLRQVALTTGHRTARPREHPAGTFLPEPEHPNELPEPPAPGEELGDRIADRLDRRERLQALTTRERRYLALQAIGLSYREIALREHASERTVERQLTRARRKLGQRAPRLTRPTTTRRGTTLAATSRGCESPTRSPHANPRSSPPRPSPALSLRHPECQLIWSHQPATEPTYGRGWKPSRLGLCSAMKLQPITYRGRTVAAATPRRFFLADELLARPTGDPETVFVCYMCAYARDVLTGELPGPYTEQNARRFAQAALIPGELLEREHINTDRAAATLGIPEHELAAALAYAKASRDTPLVPRQR